MPLMYSHKYVTRTYTLALQFTPRRASLSVPNATHTYPTTRIAAPTHRTNPPHHPPHPHPCHPCLCLLHSSILTHTYYPPPQIHPYPPTTHPPATPPSQALLEKFYVAVDEQKSVEKTLKSVSAKKHRGDATRKLNNASEAHATSVTALAHLEQRVLHDMASIREAKSQLVMESLCQLLQRQRQHYEYAHTKYNAQDALISGALDRTQETRQEITDVQMQRTTGVLEAGRFADHTAGKLDFDSLCEGGNLVPSTEEPHLFGGENTLLRVDRVVSLNVLALGMNVEGTNRNSAQQHMWPHMEPTPPYPYARLARHPTH